MMRRTAACAGLALAIYLSAWIPLDSKPLKVVQPLYFDDIDAVVLQGNPHLVTFSLGAPKASYNPSEISKLVQHRKGRVLVIYPEDASRYGYEIQLPPTLRRLDVEGGDVMAEKGVGIRRLEVRIRRDLEWTGDIPRLDIIDTRTKAIVDCDYCGTGITIRDGDIDELRISTGFGRVEIESPDNIGSAILFLGPDARFSLGTAKRQGNLRLLPWKAGIIDEPQTDPGTP